MWQQRRNTRNKVGWISFLNKWGAEVELTRREKANSNKPWTDEEEKKLIKMKQSGHSNKEIAEALGRSTGAVQIRTKILNVK